MPGKVSDEVERLYRSGSDVCLSRFRIIHTDGTVTLSGPKEVPHDDSFVWLLCNDVRLSPLYRSRVVRAVGGFNASLPCCQDFDLNLRIALKGAGYILANEIGYEFRRQPGSVSSDEIRLYRVMVSVLTGIAHHIERDDHIRERRFMALAAKMSSCGRWLLRFGDAQGGLEAFKAAASVHESGGLRSAYSVPALWLRRGLGPVLAECLLWRLRCLRNRRFDIKCLSISNR